MLELVGAGLSGGVLAAITADGVAVYGLLALVIGLIAWSKYSEPPIADPYAPRPAARLADDAATGVGAAESPTSTAAEVRAPRS